MCGATALAVRPAEGLAGPMSAASPQRAGLSASVEKVYYRAIAAVIIAEATAFRAPRLRRCRARRQRAHHERFRLPQSMACGRIDFPKEYPEIELYRRDGGLWRNIVAFAQSWLARKQASPISNSSASATLGNAVRLDAARVRKRRERRVWNQRQGVARNSGLFGAR